MLTGVMGLRSHQIVKGREKKNRPRESSPLGVNRRYHLFPYVLLLLLLVGGGFFLLEKWQHNVVEMAPKPMPVMVKRVAIYGEMRRIDPMVVEQLVYDSARDGMLALDLVRLRGILEELPWVYRAKVRKMWPDTIEIWLQEQYAVAVWGDDGYLNRDGEFFESAGVRSPASELPSIISVRNDTESIYSQFLRFSQIVGGTTENDGNHGIKQMVVDRRGAVTLHLEGGLELNLGRRLMEQRLMRWSEQSPVIMDYLDGEVQQVDLRYEQGMAVTAR